MAAPIIAAAAIGAGASLLGSAISSYSQYKAQEAEIEARKDAARELRQQGAITDAQYNELINNINQYYNTRGGLGTLQNANEYKKAITNYDPNKFSTIDYSKIANADEKGNFNVDYTKEDFVNPYYSRIIGDTANTIQHTAAGAGLGRGTGAALNIAKGTAEKSDELYRTAMQDYQNERNFDYKKYTDAISNNWKQLDALRSGTEYKIGLQGNLAADYYNVKDQAMADQMKAQQDRLAAQQTYANAISGLY